MTIRLDVKALFFNSTTSAVTRAELDPSEKKIKFAHKLLKAKQAQGLFKSNTSKTFCNQKSIKYYSLMSKLITLEKCNEKQVLKPKANLAHGGAVSKPDEIAQNILDKVLRIYQGSHPDNIYTKSRSLDAHLEVSARQHCVREDNVPLQERLERSVNLKTANCEEKAWIAYTLCKKEDLSPIINVYEAPKSSFDHLACEVKINNTVYIIDPWAGIASIKDHYLPLLTATFERWSGEGRYVLNRKNPIPDLYENAEKLKESQYTAHDFSALILTEKLGYDEINTAVNDDFYKLLENS